MPRATPEQSGRQGRAASRHFAFGSTVILLLPEAVRLVKDQLQSGAPILHGQAVGQTLDVS